MTRHLLELGHRRIGFILGRPGHGATDERYRGFGDEMRAGGVPVDAELVKTGNFVFADGLVCAAEILRSPSRPTAIFASNDDTAAAVIAVARRMGLSLPDQLSVAGFDDAPVATMIWPELTTIRQPVAALARTATELIIEHSPRRRGWPEPVPHRLLDFELVARGSTAPPRSFRGADRGPLASTTVVHVTVVTQAVFFRATRLSSVSARLRVRYGGATPHGRGPQRRSRSRHRPETGRCGRGTGACRKAGRPL